MEKIKAENFNAVPNMPDYYMSHGYIDGTSKLITIIIISK